MDIRHALTTDLDSIMKIYTQARAFMALHGNPNQWIDGYPSPEIILKDITEGNAYVCLENDEIIGVFTCILGEEPTYQRIEHGAWHYDRPYVTIHRIASNGKVHGLAQNCFAYCLNLSPYIRIDTHTDNLPMQKAILRYGFRPCGIIHVANGSERVAFDFLAN